MALTPDDIAGSPIWPGLNCIRMKVSACSLSSMVFSASSSHACRRHHRRRAAGHPVAVASRTLRCACATTWPSPNRTSARPTSAARRPSSAACSGAQGDRMSRRCIQPALHDLGVAELAQPSRRPGIQLSRRRSISGPRAAHESLGAFLADEEVTMNQARPAADARLAAGAAGPLEGVPMAHKDIFVTRDLPPPPAQDAGRLPARSTPPWCALADAGAVTLGKLNCDEFAMGSATRTRPSAGAQPLGLSRVPGGSSGGSAAAVAARLAPAATGTDTGGSIRQPAALRHHRHQADLWPCASRYGMIAFASSLDQAGPMARRPRTAPAAVGHVRPTTADRRFPPLDCRPKTSQRDGAR
jgi:hypothetical protein